MAKVDWSRIKAVVFDFDGTLYDKKNFPFWLLLMDPLDIRNVGTERSVRKEMKDKDFGSSQAFDDFFFKRLGERQKRTAEKAKAWFNDIYLGKFLKVLRKHYHAQPKVDDLLNRLRELDVKTAVFSDYSRTEERMEALGLSASKFDFCFSAPTMGALKPASRLIRQIVSDMGVEGQEILVVGDRVDTDGASASAVDGQFVQIVRKKSEEEASHPIMLWEEFVDDAMSVPMG